MKRIFPKGDLMYLAELHGKLSSHVERKEDILTSNVFSFFKYSNRKVYLKELMKLLEIEVTNIDLETADFKFWPKYDDYTQPDLVTVVGDNYILWEAKYFSDFGGQENKTKSQITREIEGGLNEAKTLGKRFYYVAITADYVIGKKFSHIPEEYVGTFKWLNWQSISFVLLQLLEQYGQELPNFEFANDLYRLLDKKNLRSFQSFSRLNGIYKGKKLEKVFFSPQSAIYRGQFLGFEEALAGFHLTMPVKEIFYQSGQYRGKFLGFANALSGFHINKPEKRIFYQNNYFPSIKYDIPAPSETLFYKGRA